MIIRCTWINFDAGIPTKPPSELEFQQLKAADKKEYIKMLKVERKSRRKQMNQAFKGELGCCGICLLVVLICAPLIIYNIYETISFLILMTAFLGMVVSVLSWSRSAISRDDALMTRYHYFVTLKNLTDKSSSYTEFYDKWRNRRW